MSGIPREDTAAAVQPLLPDGWRVLTHLGTDDNSDAPVTLRLAQQAIRPLQGFRTPQVEVQFEATLTVPHEDPEAAEDALDDAMLSLAVILSGSTDGAKRVRWGEFTKALVDGRWGYQGPITITASADRKA